MSSDNTGSPDQSLTIRMLLHTDFLTKSYVLACHDSNQNVGDAISQLRDGLQDRQTPKQFRAVEDWEWYISDENLERAVDLTVDKAEEILKGSAVSTSEDLSHFIRKICKICKSKTGIHILAVPPGLDAVLRIRRLTVIYLKNVKKWSITDFENLNDCEEGTSATLDEAKEALDSPISYPTAESERLVQASSLPKDLTTVLFENGLATREDLKLFEDCMRNGPPELCESVDLKENSSTKLTVLKKEFFDGIVNRPGAKDKVRYNQDEPFPVVTHLALPDHSECCKHSPKPDFYIILKTPKDASKPKHIIPLLFGENFSEPGEEDRPKMLAGAMCLSRVYDHCKSGKKPFVVNAVYVTANFDIEWYIFVAQEGRKVTYQKALFCIRVETDALRFLLRLHNLVKWGQEQAKRIDEGRVKQFVKEVAAASKSILSQNALKNNRPQGRESTSEISHGAQPGETKFSWRTQQVTEFLLINRMTIVDFLRFNNPYVVQAKMNGETYVLKYSAGVTEYDILALLNKRGANKNHVAGFIDTLKTSGGFVMLFPFYGFPLLRHKWQSQFFMPLVQQLLESLLFIHLSGVAHCDMKPDNTLVDDTGKLTIADFGCAERVEQDDSLIFSVRGTEGWMAPEVLDGERKGYNPKLADIWSTGRMIEEMCKQCDDEQKELADRVREIAACMQNEDPLQRLSASEAKKKILQISDHIDKHAVLESPKPISRKRKRKLKHKQDARRCKPPK